MRILPTDRKWSSLVLLPFKAYMVVAPFCLFFLKLATDGHRTKYGLADAAAIVLLGYLLCSVVFVLVAVILFFTHRREYVAENILLAGVALLIALLFSSLCAVS